jgi:adenosine deaminase
VASLASHPLRRFLDAGVLVSVGTDDPAMFGLSLAGELAALQERLGLSDDAVRRLVLNAVESCWLAAERRAGLRARIVGDPAWAE